MGATRDGSVAGPVAYEVAEVGLADLGQRRIEWAGRSMPVLGAIRRRFASTRPLAGLRVAACMQVTAETANLLDTLRAGGARVTIAASNPLSTQDDTAAALVRHHGIGVFAVNGVDQAEYRRHLLAALATEPALILDEGGDLVHALHTTAADRAGPVLAGCEATATGAVRLHQMQREGVLRMPMVVVDDTPGRRLLDNRYGTGQSVLDGIIRASNLLLAGRTVVVAGYGHCGTGLAERARGLGARVVVTEVDPVRALDAALQGYWVLPMDRAAALGDVFITATGSCAVIRAEHLLAMRDGAILANAGHFDVEIDVPALVELAVDVRPEVRPHADEYVLPDGRRLVLLGQGRVVNLIAAEGNPAASMDISFADHALTMAWLAASHATLAPAVHPVPDDIGREVVRLALASMQVEIDILTPDQEAYLRSWHQGPD